MAQKKSATSKSAKPAAKKAASTPAPPKAKKEARPKAAEAPAADEPLTHDVEAARMDALRALLGRKREELIQTIRTEVSRYIKGEDRQIVENALDDGDWSVFDLNEDLKIKKLSSYRQSLIKVDDSIRKLEEGTYGTCDDCGEQISAERLRILPFAIRCRDCQETVEEIEAAEGGESMVFHSSSGSDED